MEINFQAAINAMGGAPAIRRIANAARTPADYLFATLLPERRLPTYQADDGAMVVRATMAGAVGMDSKYPEGGVVTLTTFLSELMKLAIQTNLSEKLRRSIRMLVERAVLDGGNAGAITERAILNFVDKLLLQPQWDRAEWLRGRALVADAIVWTFNGVDLALAYQSPAANFLATRTGTDAYGGSTSKFWEDVKLARRALKGGLRIAIAHSDTIDAIIYNDVNAVNVLADGGPGGEVRIQRFRGSLERPSTDARETLTLIRYDKEGEVLDLAAQAATPGATIKVPFTPRGSVLYVAANDGGGEFTVEEGTGSTDDGTRELELGYTHVGPTEEADGATGIWSRVYSPEDMPMQLRGQSVSNQLPVLTNRAKRAVSSTVLS